MSDGRTVGRRLAHHAFSTKELVPGHVVGAAILLFGTIAAARAVVAAGQEASREMLLPQGTPRDDVATRGGAANDRGQYGGQP